MLFRSYGEEKVVGEADVDGEEGGGDSASAAKEAPAKDKYFIVKSLTVEDLEMSVRNGLWATQLHNEAALDKAYKVRFLPILISSLSSPLRPFSRLIQTPPCHPLPRSLSSTTPLNPHLNKICQIQTQS